MDTKNPLPILEEGYAPVTFDKSSVGDTGTEDNKKFRPLWPLIRLSTKSGRCQCLESVFIVSIFIILRLIVHHMCLDICVLKNKFRVLVAGQE